MHDDVCLELLVYFVFLVFQNKYTAKHAESQSLAGGALSFWFVYLENGHVGCISKASKHVSAWFQTSGSQLTAHNIVTGAVLIDYCFPRSEKQSTNQSFEGRIKNEDVIFLHTYCRRLNHFFQAWKIERLWKTLTVLSDRYHSLCVDWRLTLVGQMHHLLLIG